MTRVIVHAGFHKTGTSSLQAYLGRHRTTFSPWFAYYGPGEFADAGAKSRIYAQHPFPWRLAAFRRAFRRFLDGIADAPTIVLSRENFSGNMPGHRDWRGRTLMDFRTAAVPLMRVIRAELERRFGPDVAIELLYTTRARDGWIGSVYGHLLRSIHLTETRDAFAARLAATPALDAEASAIAAAVGLPVTIRALEDLGQSRPGPALAVLEMTGVPATAWAALPPAGRANEGQSAAMAEAFLVLNRSGKSKPELKRRKDEMIAKSRGGR